MGTKKLYPAIDYTSRDFNSIKNDLVNYAKRYYPNTFQDFNEAGFGALMLDTVSYVGDILSYYVDYSANETFLDTALEYNNVLKLGRQMGFRLTGNPSSSGIATFYIIVPASVTGLGPDTRYLPILKQGTALSSDGGSQFILNEDVVFSDPKNEVVVSAANENTGVPTFFAIRATGQVISGEIREETIDVGDFEKFRRIELSDENITEILGCTDTNGHQYFRVDYLSQDVIFKAVTNRDASSNDKAASLLKPVVVPRRFTVERDRLKTTLQFGFGSERDVTSDPLIDPATTILDFHAREFVTETSFDPSNLLGTNKLGISPANTSLRVVYRVNTTDTVNIGANGLTAVADALFQFEDVNSLNSNDVVQVQKSLEVSNDEPILGDVSLPTTDELKIRIYDNFASQNRAVSAQDYRALTYQMPGEFGAVKRVNIIRDADSQKRNLNLYVISEDSRGHLEQTNMTVKRNLKTWLNKSRMINDTIDILNTMIVNMQITFTIVADLEANKFAVLNAANLAVADLFRQQQDIGEPFFITDIYARLNAVRGVVDTTQVNVLKVSGGNYSSSHFDVEAAISPDGRYINVPENVIIEIKFPTEDIRGSVL